MIGMQHSIFQFQKTARLDFQGDITVRGNIPVRGVFSAPADAKLLHHSTFT